MWMNGDFLKAQCKKCDHAKLLKAVFCWIVHLRAFPIRQTEGDSSSSSSSSSSGSESNCSGKDDDGDDAGYGDGDDAGYGDAPADNDDYLFD